MAGSKAKQPLTPFPILKDLWGARAAQALIAATDLEVFSHIARGKHTDGAIARAAGSAPGPTGRLLNALVGMGYLRKRGDRYALEPISRRYLVKNSPSYVGGMADETRLSWDTWKGLTETVRTGRRQVAFNSEAEGAEFFSRLVRAIFPLSYAAARVGAKALSATSARNCRRILDVAAGAAPWSIAFAQKLPRARVTALDFGNVLPVAEEYATRFGVRERFELLAGNARETDFGRNQYDLVILGHIIHSEGEKWGKKLIRKSYRALRPGGTILIAELIADDDRGGPALPLIFGLNMLLNTDEGDVFTWKEYRRWLDDAGFTAVRKLDVPAPSPLILATKPGG